MKGPGDSEGFGLRVKGSVQNVPCYKRYLVETPPHTLKPRP